MKAFFDSSVLVPVFYGDHVHHEASLDLFIQFDKSSGCCGAHSLAEVFSTLTRMPGKHRISGEQAMLFIGNIRERLSIIALSGDEYADALEASAALGIVGAPSMTPCLRIAPSRPKQKRSIRGMYATTASVDPMSPGACGRLEAFLPVVILVRYLI
jgi:hypothetical protein